MALSKDEYYCLEKLVARMERATLSSSLRVDEVNALPTRKISKHWQRARAVFFGESLLNAVRTRQIESMYENDWTGCPQETARQFRMHTGESTDFQGNWSLDQTAYLCDEGGESKFLGKAELLLKESFSSVTRAVEELNTPEGEFACIEGFCVVFSASQRQYFILYKRERKQEQSNNAFFYIIFYYLFPCVCPLCELFVRTKY